MMLDVITVPQRYKQNLWSFVTSLLLCAMCTIGHAIWLKITWQQDIALHSGGLTISINSMCKQIVQHRERGKEKERQHWWMRECEPFYRYEQL